MLGGGPLDGSPEPECDPAYDLVGIAEDQVEDQDARGEVVILMVTLVMLIIIMMMVLMMLMSTNT